MKNILVTGANGHVGFNLAKALMEKGYRPRVSVRNADDPAKAGPLRALGLDDIVSLDVNNPDQFSAATAGIDTLFHVAATYKYFTGGPEGDRQLIADSVEGTRSALNAAKGNGVAKVVMTSSTVTLPLTAPGAPPVTEDDWTDDLRTPYIRAKVEAEKIAWAMAGDLNLDLVTILPGGILGGEFHRRTTSTDMVEGIMLGTMRLGAPEGKFPFVDVADVVTGHILAAEKHCAGRFIIAADQFPTLQEMTRVMHAIDPRIPESKMLLPDFVLGLMPFFDWMNNKLLGAPRLMTPEFTATMRGKVFNTSNARAKEVLGWRQAVSLEQSLRTTIDRLREIRKAEGS